MSGRTVLVLGLALPGCVFVSDETLADRLDTGVGESDSGTGCATPATWYQDADGDGHADAATATESCDWPGEGWLAGVEADDCDDSDPDVSPSADEVCGDGVDADCDGEDGTCVRPEQVSLDAVDPLWFGEKSQRIVSSLAVGDLDCDGADDVLVGSHNNDEDGTNAGAVWLFSSDAEGGLANEQGIRLGLGETTGKVGKALAALGDVTDDGCDDLLVGASGYSNTGSAWLIAGPITDETGETGLTAAQSLYIDTYAGFGGGELGSALSGGGDYDGDEVADIVLADVSNGGYGDMVMVVSTASTGQVDLFYGGLTHAVFQDTSGSSSNFGSAVLGPEDLDGDGLGELVIGASADSDAAGSVYVVPGGTTGEVQAASLEYRVDDDEVGGALGSALALGDLDGDGSADVAAGAPEHAESAGRVMVWSGGGLDLGEAVATLVGNTVDGAAGTSVTVVDDVDGDGTAELLVGAPGLVGGGAWMVHGPLSGSIELVAGADVTAIAPGGGWSQAGAVVTTAPDRDGDGLPEVVVADTLAFHDGSNGGAVGLLSSTLFAAE